MICQHEWRNRGAGHFCIKCRQRYLAREDRTFKPEWRRSAMGTIFIDTKEKDGSGLLTGTKYELIELRPLDFI